MSEEPKNLPEETDQPETEKQEAQPEVPEAPGPQEQIESGEETSEDGAADKPPQPAQKKPVDPALARAYRTHRPVNGKVEAVIKGGFEIRVGKSRAFCPFSQIELHRSEEPEQHVGQSYPFKIIQFRRGGEDVVLSRRALLEDRNQEEAKAVRATLIEGALMQGHVAGIADFGAFVDLGAGVQGLVHISELSHARVTRVGDAVQVGQTVQVKILKLHDKGGKISLSIRQAQDDPWNEVQTRFLVGSRYPGTVRRLADFGAFVEMSPGLEALAPAREFPPREQDWTEWLKPGTAMEWIILAVDTSRRRMSILPVAEGMPEAAVKLEAGAELTGLVQKIERFGVFVWLAPGKVGLMPTAFTGIPQGSRMDSHFTVGGEVAVEVLDIADGGRRIRLAAQGDGVARARAEAEKPQGERRKRSDGPDNRDRSPDRGDPAREEDQGTFGTSMADLLKAALEDKKP